MAERYAACGGFLPGYFIAFAEGKRSYMTLVAVPVSLKSRRGLTLLVAAGVVALIAVGAAWAVMKWSARSASSSLTAGKFYAVAPIDFDVKVAKDGELAAVNNIDILNLVEGQSTIVQIVKEGAYVKKGDVLVELDSADDAPRADHFMTAHAAPVAISATTPAATSQVRPRRDFSETGTATRVM